MSSQKPTINDWDLSTTNLRRLKNVNYEVAVIPVGATEAHNWHLPEGLDFMHAGHVARESCRKAWQNCQNIVCLPPLPYGVDCNQMSFPLAIHLSQSTLDQVMREIITSLKHHGIRKIVIVNGHGGNNFEPFVRQVQSDLDVHVFLCNWWKIGFDKYDEIFTRPDDHGGQMETSVAMALCPELVEIENAGTGHAPPFRFEALNKGWVKTSRDFGKLNDHCGVGNPEGSTPERGRQYLELACDRLSGFLTDLATTPIDDNFPMQP
ncbi:Creatinine amidohydrolase [Anaerohalosphaera lusitana]|uniref:Creatinine amidohydrolase n=1 Tax=Anaerohalosphaera lusitana TaxID=1936003 RepID=A0A1U9NP90_9BACT|nr:creatininase family protein [Anaerohalosphaera lusitana]AQT69617.1 Creatinine amidohydrolase [Anaerohalosphaera lusitana]